MIKNILLFTLFIFSNYIHANNVASTAHLDGINTVTLNEHNLWSSVNDSSAPESFTELTNLFTNAAPVSSSQGGRGAFITAIKVINTANSHNTWFVNLHVNYLDIGQAYWQTEQGKVIPLEDFGHIGTENPKMAHSQTFSLPLADSQSGTLWIYIQAKVFPTPAVINIYNQANFYKKQVLINNITSIAFTVMITLALLALFTYLNTKYIITLACAGYIGLHGIGWFAASGSLGYLLPITSFNPVYSGMILFPFAIAAASQFTKLLFNCKQEHPRLANLFNYLSIFSVVIGLLMPFVPFTLSYFISHIIATIWIPLSISTGIFMLRKRDFTAKYYLIGNLLYGLTLAVYVLSHAYNIDWYIYPELIVQIALALDCLCILLALAEWLQIKQKEFNRSYKTSRVDPLTQIGNRFAQNEMLGKLQGHYSLTFIDLDNFKEINDRLGHDTGDKYLVAAAQIMKKNLAELGTIFRCGGDEFIWVVKIKNAQDTESLLIQISELLLASETELQQSGWQQASLSFGIATSFETLNQSECLSLADQRMYQHKQNKKNSTNLPQNSL
ncbi:hypothetical protein GCM10009111_18170 [Colwellia asteriadis]|uniref:diguanylate cyclase n=1 Tax=Colwellia asteriadis TaxID=517723 RepID=A0ABP3WGW6_9GAMM